LRSSPIRARSAGMPSAGPRRDASRSDGRPTARIRAAARAARAGARRPVSLVAGRHDDPSDGAPLELRVCLVAWGGHLVVGELVRAARVLAAPNSRSCRSSRRRRVEASSAAAWASV
jgi:hypothetical protein